MEMMQKQKQKKILIIDDDMKIGNLEQEVLEQAGYYCNRAYSGTEALLCLEHTRPDLILRGAEDYITKPFSTKELLVRIEVQIRKVVSPLSDVFRYKERKGCVNSIRIFRHLPI